MKLMGVSLSYPVLDLRVALCPETRLRFLSPFIAKAGVTYLNGFGLAGERRLRIPWRPAETIYFECRGAIALPQTLPDDAPVTRVIRRVYFDGGVSSRFDFSIFGNPAHTFEPSSPDPRGWAGGFWHSRVSVRETAMSIRTAPLHKALSVILRKFALVSGPRGHGRSDLVRPLCPQLILVLKGEPKELTRLRLRPTSCSSRVGSGWMGASGSG